MLDDEKGWKPKKQDKKDAIKSWVRRVEGSSVALFKVYLLRLLLLSPARRSAILFWLPNTT